MGEYEYYHFNYEMFKKAAVSFCISLVDLCEPEQTKVKQIMEEIEQNILKPSGNDKKDDKGLGNKEYIFYPVDLSLNKFNLGILIQIIQVKILNLQ